MTNSGSNAHIGVLLFPDVEELDAIGPWETLSLWTRLFPDNGYTVTTLSSDGEPLRCGLGLTVHPDHSYATAPRYDVLVHPGGRGTEPQLDDPDHLEWIRARRDEVPLMASVCTGALVYAAAGLLRSRPATTHHRYLDQLASLDPTIAVHRDERYVDDGDIVTSAGISAGIDMGLHLVGRLGGKSQEATVRDVMQYQP